MELVAGGVHLLAAVKMDTQLVAWVALEPLRQVVEEDRKLLLYFLQKMAQAAVLLLIFQLKLLAVVVEVAAV